jgi:hypothetical protein
MPKKRKTLAAAGQKALPHVIFAPHLKKKGRITPFSITKTESIGATVGIQFVTFEYQDLGGRSNLLPGFAHRAHEQLRWPKGAGAGAVFLAAFDVGFYDENGNLVDHSLGRLVISLGFTHDNKTINCDFLLRDSSTSEGVRMYASGVVLYFAA